MKDKKLPGTARNDGVRSAGIVAEFNKHRIFWKRFDNSADLPPRETFRRMVRQQRNHVQQRRLANVVRIHHSTQHVTNRGVSSPARMSHKLLITA